MTMSADSDSSVEQQREHFTSIAEQYFATRKHASYLPLKELIGKSFFVRNPGISGGYGGRSIRCAG
jgi:hypothetical protein